MFGKLFKNFKPYAGAKQDILNAPSPMAGLFGMINRGSQQLSPSPPPTHQPPIQNPQFGMAQGSAQGMGTPQYNTQFPQGQFSGMASSPYAQQFQQQDPYGYMPPYMGALMKQFGVNNTGRWR